MRSVLILLAAVFCSGCSTLANEFVDAPMDHAKAVVFDIDGTLTPTPLSIWSVREAAAETVQHFANQGFTIFYVTARIPLFQWQIPGWLESNHFPTGNLYLTQNSEDRSDHERFKTRILNQLIEHGWVIERAFGDSSSDFKAYSAANLTQEQVFALLRQGSDQCQPGVWARCLTSWLEYLNTVNP